MTDVGTYHILLMIMTKSIRISDSLFKTAQSRAGENVRSTVQQIEYWAQIGHKFEPLVSTIIIPNTDWGNAEDMDELIKYATSEEGQAA